MSEFRFEDMARALLLLDHSEDVVATLEAVVTARMADAWDEGATKASPHPGGYLRSLLIENPYREVTQ